MADQPETTTEEKRPKWLEDIQGVWERFPRGIRVLMVAVAIMAIAGGITMTMMDRPNYKVLFSGLSQEDAAAIIEKLKEKHVVYRIEGAGQTIMVPAEQVHDLRLELAGEGLPIGGGVGFELFDEQRFGMTQFEEKMALRRALEGELSRTISRLDAVKSARVHLVLTEKSMFKRKNMPARGAVTLELQAKRELADETIQSIIHLVSSSVEGLNPDQVTVVDTRGRLLSADHVEGVNARGLKYQREYEQTMELRLREMLDQILGPGESVVRVSANFDFSNRETQEERYDPDRSVLRSEQRETESSGAGMNGASGTPGARSNLPGGATPNSTAGSANTRREMETRNYEVDKVVNHIVGPGATLLKLSAAILVDGVNDGSDKFKPRPTEELRKIELAVKSAMGYDATRGDHVEVQSIPFHVPEEIEVPPIEGPPIWKELLPIAVGVGIAIFLLIIILSFRKKGKVKEELPANALALPKKVQELETMIAEQGAMASLPEGGNEAPDPMSAAALVGEVQKVFVNESENASKVLRTWLKEARQGQRVLSK